MPLLRIYRFRRSLGMRRTVALRYATQSLLRDWHNALTSRRLLRHQPPFTDTRV